MYFQRRYLEQSKAIIGTSGLLTIDLPNKGLLAGIQLRVQGKNPDASGLADIWLHDRLEKVELIVNGSQVVKSLTGEQVLALMHYKRIPATHAEQLNKANDYVNSYFYIPLGRFYLDKDYMLDLGRVNDPELRISYNFNDKDPNGWTNGQALTTDVTPSYDLICHLCRDYPGTPKGYIKTSEIYRHTSGKDLKTNMTIPRGPVYSNLYLQSWYKSHGLDSEADMIELNINSGEIIPLRESIWRVMADVLRMYGPYEGTIVIDATSGQAYPIFIESGTVIGHMEAVGDYDVRHSFCGNNGWFIKFVKPTTGVGLATAHECAFHYKGVYPFSVAAIPYFDPMDESTWVKSAELGDFWLRVEAGGGGSTSATVKLLADEVVSTYI